MGLALQKKNYSLHVNTTGGQAYLARSFADRLERRALAPRASDSAASTTLLAVLTEMVSQANRLTPPDPDMT